MTFRSSQDAVTPSARHGTQPAWPVRSALAVIYGLLFAVAALRLCVGEQFRWPGGGLLRAVQRAFAGWYPLSDSVLTEMDIRLHRAVLATLVGGGLATSGVALQALLRNPLAEPFILGLSTGATVGVVALQWWGDGAAAAALPQHGAALAGAAACMLIVYAASQRGGRIDPMGLLLVGVVLSTIGGSIVMLMHYLMADGATPVLTRWIMGYLNEGLEPATVWAVAATTAAGFLLMLVWGRRMDIGTFSDAEAAALGVDLWRLRAAEFIVASTLAAGAVVLSGPVAFVGFISPHLARLVVGPSHRAVLMAAAPIGAMLILLADTISVLIDACWNTGRMPIGIFTAIAGGVLFVWMLRRRRGDYAMAG